MSVDEADLPRPCFFRMIRPLYSSSRKILTDNLNQSLERQSAWKGTFERPGGTDIIAFFCPFHFTVKMLKIMKGIWCIIGKEPMPIEDILTAIIIGLAGISIVNSDR